jgi:hypothetical protein
MLRTWLKPGSIVLTAEVRGAMALLAIVPDRFSVKIWMSPRANSEFPTVAYSFAGVIELRHIATLLAHGHNLSCPVLCFESASIEGVEGLWAEVLLLSWIRSGSGPGNPAALALLSLDEAHLARLWARYVRFADASFALLLNSLLARAAAHGLKEKNLSDLLRIASPEDDSDLGSLGDFLDDLDQRSSGTRDRCLEIYRDAIERDLGAWSLLNKPHRKPRKMPDHQVRLRSLRRYVEDYVATHEELPSGVHCICLGPDNALSPVDFDSLRAKEPSSSVSLQVRGES